MAFGITVDKKPLEDGNKAADAFKSKLSQVGGAIAAAFALDKVTDFVTDMVSAADAVGDQAARLNMSSQALEEWTYQAKFADIAAGELDGIFNKLARSSVEAGDATSEQGKTLAKLGIQVKDANGNFKDTSTLFEEVGFALAGMDDQTKRTALSMDFFGKTAGPKVLQLFKDGPEGVKKLRAEFEALGGGFGDFVEQAGEVDDNMHRLDLAWTGTKTRIMGFVAPALNWLLSMFMKAAAFTSKLADETNILQSALVVFSAVAAGAAAPILAAWWPVILPFLKWAAAIAFAVLVVDDLITAWQGGDSVIGRIVDRLFGKGSTRKVVSWIKDTGEAFATFFDDLANHPDKFAKNWAVASNSIQNDLTQSLGPTFGGWAAALIDEFAFVMTTFTGGWENFKEKWSAVGDGILLAFKIAWTEIKFFGLGVVASLDDAITSLLKKIPGGLLDSLGGSGTAAADVAKLREKARFAIAAEGDDIGRRLNAPADQRPAHVSREDNLAYARAKEAIRTGKVSPEQVNAVITQNFNLQGADLAANKLSAAKAILEKAAEKGARSGVNRAAAASFRGKK